MVLDYVYFICQQMSRAVRYSNICKYFLYVALVGLNESPCVYLCISFLNSLELGCVEVAA
jgi:hypothetical protein